MVFLVLLRASMLATAVALIHTLFGSAAFADAVVLGNGDVLHGQAWEQDGRVHVMHPVLGEVSVDRARVLEIRRGVVEPPVQRVLQRGAPLLAAPGPVPVARGTAAGASQPPAAALAPPPALAAACPPPPVCAPEPPCEPPPEPCSPWGFEFGILGGLTRGNTETLDLKLDALATYERGPWVAKASGLFWYGEDEGRRTNESYSGTLRGERKLRGGQYVFVQTIYDRDEPAGLQHRFANIAGYGRTLIERGALKIQGEVGAGVTHERRYKEAPRTDPSGWFGLKGEYAPEGGPKLIASYDFLPNLVDFDLSTSTFDLRVQQALTSFCDATIGLRADWTIDPPGEDVDPFDVLLSVGLRFKP